MSKFDYDVAIVGGGLAGLSLAYRLAEDSFRSKSIALVEPRLEYGRDRTWSSWDVRPHPFAQLVRHRWPAWSVHAGSASNVVRSSRFSYCKIESQDFYQEAIAKINAAPHLHFMQGVDAHDVRDEGSAAVVETSAGSIRARHAFDTRPRRGPNPVMRQQFMGLEIETEQAVFDPGVATLMDFRVSQPGHPRFFYVLPVSPTRALVEDTHLAPAGATCDLSREKIAAYLERFWGVSSYTELESERGVIPMEVSRSPEAASGSVVIPFGVRGGAAKPSTGYAFPNIQLASDQVASRLRHGLDPRPNQQSRANRFMDRVFLERLRRDPEAAPKTFYSLFERCGADSLVRFLNESGHPIDWLRVMLACPRAAFAGEAARLVGRTLLAYP